MRRPTLLLFSAMAGLSLAGCAGRPAPIAPAAVAPVEAAPMPQPPTGLQADTELLPTPNRGLSPAEALWHLRAGLNVAALQCAAAGSGLESDYNRLLSVHRRALAEAHEAAMSAASDRAAFDRDMTRLYNYFAQPPARGEFCAVAARVAAATAATDPGALQRVAPASLAELDAPFTKLHAAQDDYHRQLIAWRAGEAAAPRLAYDPNIFLASDRVTDGPRSTIR